jgi:FixJ family two-component response regulator
MSQDAPIVFVVDDDVSVRESLEGLVVSAGWAVETFAAARDFLLRPRSVNPSCLVLDISLPGIDGLAAQEAIAVNRPDVPIIFITGYADVPTTVKAMKAGAAEFLTKPFNDEILLSAIARALENSRAALSREADLQTLRDCYASLSRREREVMGLIVSGLPNKQVGAKLSISEITVKAHRGRVMEKMKATSFAALVSMAPKLGQAPSEGG